MPSRWKRQHLLYDGMETSILFCNPLIPSVNPKSVRQDIAPGIL
jgi:hypothetical protein